ncbi:MAG: biotin synthase BioB [Gammaproteobacteria bacterium]|nr:biotin synthase BioB [Gammaproteobacteria bacterium]
MQKKSWLISEVQAIYALPFIELLFQAQLIHRENFDPLSIEQCSLLSIKTGTCPEDCAYCPQSGHYQTGLQKEKLLTVEAVKKAAMSAKQNGAKRFCMGAAWRSPSDKQLNDVIKMVAEVKALGLETCLTLGMLTHHQAQRLKESGLDFYNHNLDTSDHYYKKIISTRTYQDRLDTLEHVRKAGIHVCCGGIIGMGETKEDRIALLTQLANLPKHPESVPINRLIPIEGTPLANVEIIDNVEFIRTIAVARILMPLSIVRLSAGRETMSEEMHALCFLAGANSIFIGDVLLTANNPTVNHDQILFEKLGLSASLQSLSSLRSC